MEAAYTLNRLEKPTRNYDTHVTTYLEREPQAGQALHLHWPGQARGASRGTRSQVVASLELGSERARPARVPLRPRAGEGRGQARVRVLRAGGGRGGGADIIVEGGLRLADGVHQGGDAALVLQPVEGRAEDLVRVGVRVGVCAADLEVLPRVAARAHDGLALLVRVRVRVRVGVRDRVRVGLGLGLGLRSLLPGVELVQVVQVRAQHVARDRRDVRDEDLGVG